MKRFEDISAISHEAVLSTIAPALKNSDKVAQVRLARALSEHFREQYLKVAAEYGKR